MPVQSSATATVVALVGPATQATSSAHVSAAQIDPLPDDNTVSVTTGVTGLTANELVHGSVQRRDLLAGSERFRIGQSPRASYEVVVDAVSGDLGAEGPGLRRVAPDGITVLQLSSPAGASSSRSLAWENAAGTAQDDELIEVGSLGCSACTPNDAFRIRAYETTSRIARFNNAGSQITVLVLQNTTDQGVAGTAWFWNGAGALLYSRPFTLEPRGQLVVNTSLVDELLGVSGSITVTSDAPYGGLSGKAVAIEPDTGFAFDSPLLARER